MLKERYKHSVQISQDRRKKASKRFTNDARSSSGFDRKYELKHFTYIKEQITVRRN